MKEPMEKHDVFRIILAGKGGTALPVPLSVLSKLEFNRT